MLVPRWGLRSFGSWRLFPHGYPFAGDPPWNQGRLGAFVLIAKWNEENIMRRMIVGLSALAFASLPVLAFADGDGALTGAAGGAVAGAVVGGPVGAAVGGAAGGVIGGVASGPRPVVVAPLPQAPPCHTRTTTTTNNNTGASVTRQATDCPD